GTQFTGAGYAVSQALAVQQVLAVLLMIGGLATLINAKIGKPYFAPIGTVGTAATVYILGMVAWPAIVQKFMVEGDKLNKEGPFAARAIKMTRYAYNLNAIEARDFPVKPEPTADEIKASQSTLDNMRLWDPDVMR